MRIGGHTLHEATAEEREVIWRTAEITGTFRSREEFDRFCCEGSWRVQVSAREEGAIVAQWRSHLSVLSVKGLWCAQRAIAPIMVQLRDLANEHGFQDLVGPITPADRIGPYLDAGMHIVHTGIAMRLDKTRDAERTRITGVELRQATVDDLSDILEIDRACFSDFWRYDAQLMREYLLSESAVLATAEGRAVGYTMGAVERGEGILGRIAVVPSCRRRGVGSALLADAITRMVRQGARGVSLYTQEDNHVARSLYEEAGFRVSGTPQHLCAFGDTRT